ncbi:MAG TPA: MFS transporter [Polyangiaceae bacterium]|nr:MFS transporter [Polyangiaceae bacterium]
MKSVVLAFWGGLPSQFWLLWTGILINRIGGFVLPLLALYLSRRGLSPEQVGFTVALFGVGNVAGSQMGGILADRIGRRRMLLLGLCTGALSMLALGFAERPVAIAVCTLTLGLFGDSHRPAMQAMVADLVSPADRARAYGLVYWALNFGFAVAVMLAGLLVKVSYWLLFVGDATGTLAYAAVVLLALKESRPLAVAERASVRSTLAPLRDQAFLAFWILSLATGGMFLQTFVSLPLAMKSDGLSPATFGRVLAINGILIVLVQPWAAPLLARLRRSVVMAGGATLIGIGLGATALAHGPGAYSLTVVIWSFGEIALLPTSAAVIADLAPANLRGTYQGAYNLAWAISWVVGPIFGTQVLGRFGRGLWAVCLGLSFLVAVGHLAIAGARRRRLAVATD